MEKFFYWFLSKLDFILFVYSDKSNFKKQLSVRSVSLDILKTYSETI